jgi:hypothetical protein
MSSERFADLSTAELIGQAGAAPMDRRASPFWATRRRPWDPPSRRAHRCRSAAINDRADRVRLSAWCANVSSGNGAQCQALAPKPKLSLTPPRLATATPRSDLRLIR